MHGRCKFLLTFLLAVMFIAGSQASLGDQAESFDWLAMAEPEVDPDVEAPMAGEQEQTARQLCPVDFEIVFELVSDHVWRGMNSTEYSGEGREDPVYHLGLQAEVSLGRLIPDVEDDIGAIGFRTFFVWFSGSNRQGKTLTTGGRADHLQEVDYTLYWRRLFTTINTEVEAGYTYYTYPGAPSSTNDTAEVYVKLSFDDSEWFQSAEPVLNPYVLYALDFDMADNGSWIELGINHPFDLGDTTLQDDMPPLSYMTITPSAALGIDHRYLQGWSETGRKSDRMALLLTGVKIDYDLSGALNMNEDKYGELLVGGFINYSYAMRRDLLNDELYGGLRVAYNW